jgi:hypothetical protein
MAVALVTAGGGASNASQEFFPIGLILFQELLYQDKNNHITLKKYKI